MAKYFYFLCSLLISVSLIILGFTSCSGSNTIATSSSRRTSTSRNTSSSSSDDKEKDDGEPCKGSDSCEETCERIYGDYSEVQKCEDEGRDKVGRLDKVYKHLKSGRYNELLDISEEDNDVDMDDFEDYLENGATGWTNIIKTWGAPDSERSAGNLISEAKLTDTLKWIIDKTSVAEVLQDNDDGLDVLETLLMEFDDLVTPSTGAGFNPAGTSGAKNIYVKNDLLRYQRCTSNNVHNYHTGGSGNLNKLYIVLKEGDDANDKCSGDQAADPPSSISDLLTIEFDSNQDRILYRGLAYLSLDGQTENIFSYATEKNNDAIRTMAYDLLNKACNNIDGNDDESIACKRSLFCWMKIRKSSLVSSRLESWIDGQSGFGSFDIDDNCTPEEFYSFLH